MASESEESQPKPGEGRPPENPEAPVAPEGESNSGSEESQQYSYEPYPAPSSSDEPHQEVKEEAKEPEEEDEGGPVKSFLEHLEDLRWVIIKCGASLLVGMAVCLAGAPALVSILSWPLRMSGAKVDLNPLGPLAPVVISMKIALYGGLTAALPFILFFIGQYIMPALKAKEKIYFLRAFIIGGGLFLTGVCLCYFFILRISLMGMVKYAKWMGLETTIWRAEDYFQFVILFMIGMGVSLELPVLILTLVKIGLIQHESLVKGRKYFIVANVTACALVTPDPISLFLMLIPVQLLMEICILISAYWERQKRAAEAAMAGQQSKGISSAD